MTCGLAFTACAVDDNPNPDPTYPFDAEEYWNNKTTTYDFEDGETTVFKATSRMSVEIQDNAGKGSKVLALKNAGNTQNGYGFTYYDMTDKVEKATKVAIKFDYYNGQGRGCITIGDALVRGTDGKGAGMDRINRAPFYGQKGAILRVGNSDNGRNYIVNDEVIGTADELCNKWLTISVNVYPISREVEWTIIGKDEIGNDSIIAQSGITVGEGEEAEFVPSRIGYWQEDADECTQIDVFGFINNNVSYIDNLSITNAQDPGIKYADDVKIMYVDTDGNELKESKTVSARVGSIVKLAGVDMASFYNADNTKKYIYVSDDTETTPVAESGTVIKVVFREAEIYYPILRCMAGSTVLEQFRDEAKYWFFEGDNFEIYPPRGYTKNGSTYFTPATSYNAVKFTFPGELQPMVNGGKTYYVGTLNYEKDENAVYYSEAERLALPTEDAGYGVGLGQLFGTVNSWYSFSGGLFDRFSGYRGIRLDADSYIWTEPIAEGGTYNVKVYGRNDSNDAAEPPYVLGIKTGDEITWLTELTIPSWGGAVTGDNTAEGVEIPAGSSLVIKNDNAAKLVTLDDITIFRPAAE